MLKPQELWTAWEHLGIPLERVQGCFSVKNTVGGVKGMDDNLKNWILLEHRFQVEILQIIADTLL